MLAGGIVLMVIGVGVLFVSAAGSVVLGWMFGLPLGGGLFTMGFFMAIAGAICNAIEDSTKATTAEIRAMVAAYKAGTDSLWKQLDAVRTAVASNPAPAHVPLAAQVPADTPVHVAYAIDGEGAGASRTDMGYCPNCKKLRGFSVATCVYCGSKAPAVTEP